MNLSIFLRLIFPEQRIDDDAHKVCCKRASAQYGKYQDCRERFWSNGRKPEDTSKDRHKQYAGRQMAKSHIE